MKLHGPVGVLDQGRGACLLVRLEDSHISKCHVLRVQAKKSVDLMFRIGAIDEKRTQWVAGCTATLV